ncbi:MAG TPA: amidohydrolase family protein [Chthonomonas sp.]|uniref:amidohydrolase family protein n=1 Tax=Chthonomonas sp. TaxID=2282153 RepID=UPI002B4B23E2|nr:amidohydrolase family protein [Chthonomonas sp.]HLI47245.1 amidohydrolase family protein [Chthonomonas sp.]
MSVIDCHVYIEGSPIPSTNQTAKTLAELLAGRGIDQAIVISTRAARLDPLSGNTILKNMLEQTQGLYGCLATHVRNQESSINAVRDLLGHRRFLGVLLTGDDPEEPLHPLSADEILNACRRFQKPIYLHAPNRLCVEVGLELAKRYHMHRFVLLGMGGSDWRAAILAAQQASNIFLEISGMLDLGRIPAAIEAVGAHRLLFGSGLPDLDPAAIIGLLEDSEISPSNRRRILSENAEKLFQLELGA